MDMQTFVFYGFSAIAIGSAMLLASLRNIARALFLFFITLFSVAGLYVFALADFVAITQILVYVGGVLVLMLFAFMLSNKELLNQLPFGASRVFALPVWQALLIAFSLLAIVLYAITLFHHQEPTWVANARVTNGAISPTDNTIQSIGVHLMTRYLLPFEVISVLLMMALIGAAHLSRKEANS